MNYYKSSKKSYETDEEIKELALNYLDKYQPSKKDLRLYLFRKVLSDDQGSANKSIILEQIDKIISSSQSGNKLKVYVPHSRFELLMDRIFLKVLRRRYELAPRIFTNMANSLSGDEFAKFLNGEANIKLWTKVIFAMPKIPFIAGFFETLKNKDPRW